MASKLETIAALEADEVKKLSSVKKLYPGYLLIMMAFLCIIRALDEFASTIGGNIQSWLVNEFIAVPQGISYAEALSTWSLISTAMLVVTIAAVFYLALSDRFGRKKILVISVLGMALGMLVCYAAHNLATYLIGNALITFFVATDVHGIYVMEIAPAERRATYIQTTAIVGQIGAFMVAASRILFTTEEVLQWRMLYFIPGILALICGIALLVGARETEVFRRQRIAYLSKSYEQRKAEAAAAKKEKKANENKQGIGAAFGYIFKNRQCRANIIATIPQLFAIMAFVGFTESIMTTNGMTTSQINFALLMAPIAAAVMSLFTGIACDKIGRRPTAIICSIVAFAALVGFIFTVRTGANPYLIGLINGFGIGAFFRYGDTLGLVRLESVPTAIRAATASAFGLIATVVSLISGIILSMLVAQFELSTLILIWGGATIGLSAVLNFLLVRETKGVDLDEIKYEV